MLGKLYQTRVNSAKTMVFYERVRDAVLMQGIKSFHGAEIALEVSVFPPDKRKRDLDGILKVLIDGLQRANVFDDDVQVGKLTVERKWREPLGMVIVTIRPWTMQR